MRKKLIFITAAAAAVIGLVVGVVAIGTANHGSDALAAEDSIPTAQGAWLGAAIARTPDGLTISQVIADSPADKAGLKRLDVITAVAGTQVSDMAALLNALKDKKPGDTVTLSINRGGSAQDITVTLEARPEPLPRDHPVFPELNGIPQDQLFSHMLGGSFQFTDKDGSKHTVTTDLGTVTAVDTSAKTITVDLNAGGSKTYNITDAVIIAPNDLSKFQSGDRVSIISVDGELRAISKGLGGMMPFSGKGKGGRHHGGGGFGGEGGMHGGGQGLGMMGRGAGSGL